MGELRTKSYELRAKNLGFRAQNSGTRAACLGSRRRRTRISTDGIFIVASPISTMSS